VCNSFQTKSKVFLFNDFGQAPVSAGEANYQKKHTYSGMLHKLGRLFIKITGLSSRFLGIMADM